MCKEVEFRISEIWKARHRISPYARHTPLLYSPALSAKCRAPIYLKMECWQTCGCFKIRGAGNMVAALSQEERQRGLVTASSGNHGIALSYAATFFGRPAVRIFMPQEADPTKVEKVRALGAEIVFSGVTYAEAYDQAQTFVTATGATYVHSHAHPWIIAGQGTIGLEILEDLPDVERIVVPIGGGGLISGVAAAVKAYSPGVHILGVEPEAAPGAFLSLRDGVAHERIETQKSIADGLLGGFGGLPFSISRGLIDRVALVSDQEIVPAMKLLQKEERLMVEAAAAVGLAAVLAGKIELNGQKTVIILTSRNIDAVKYQELVQ
ncbi:MAG: threonine/serine dehydratase [Coprothermobacterota bacterium]|nr:threonine/serine dehydratase [Coprothermobacterota bacterium]